MILKIELGLDFLNRIKILNNNSLEIVQNIKKNIAYLFIKL